jgi:hypothetical protein
MAFVLEHNCKCNRAHTLQNCAVVETPVMASGIVNPKLMNDYEQILLQDSPMKQPM